MNQGSEAWETLASVRSLGCSFTSGGSREARRTCGLLWPKISSFLCSFREKIGQIIGWHPSPGLAPPSGKSWIRHCSRWYSPCLAGPEAAQGFNAAAGRALSLVLVLPRTHQNTDRQCSSHSGHPETMNTSISTGVIYLSLVSMEFSSLSSWSGWNTSEDVALEVLLLLK